MNILHIIIAVLMFQAKIILIFYFNHENIIPLNSKSSFSNSKKKDKNKYKDLINNKFVLNLILHKLYDIVESNLESEDVCKNKSPNKDNLFSTKSFNRKTYLEHHNRKKFQLENILIIISLC